MSDQEQPPDPLERFQELVPAGAGSVGSALVGLVMGGPAGAIAGAVAGPALEHLAKEALALRYRRGERAYEQAANEARLTPEELLGRILADEHLLDLAADVVAAASQTHLDAKIRVLGRALAAGVLAADGAVVDEQRLIVGMLADLEVPHVRVLAQLLKQNESRDIVRRTETGEVRTTWPYGDLGKALPGFERVVEPVMAVLIAHGLAAQWEARGGSGSDWAGSITEAGERFLALLADQG